MEKDALGAGRGKRRLAGKLSFLPNMALDILYEVSVEIDFFLLIVPTSLVLFRSSLISHLETSSMSRAYPRPSVKCY